MKILLRHRKICLRPVRTVRKRQIFLRKAQTFPGEHFRVRKEHPHPFRPEDLLKGSRTVILPAHRQPGKRIRLALTGVKNAEDRLRERFFRLAGRKTFHKSLKFSALLRILQRIILLKNILQCVML